MNRFRREEKREPMSNTVGLDGQPVSVAGVILQATTSRYFAPKIDGPTNAGEALDAMFTPVNEGSITPPSAEV